MKRKTWDKKRIGIYVLLLLLSLLLELFVLPKLSFSLGFPLSTILIVIYIAVEFAWLSMDLRK